MRTRLVRSAPLLLALVAAPAARLHAQSAGSPAVDRGVQLLNEGRVADARVQLLAAAKANPKDAAAAYWVGRTFFRDTAWSRATDWFEKAVELDAARAEYHFYLGAAYGEQAQRANKFKQPFLAKKVKGEFERAVALDPNYLDARAGLADFYRMAPGIMGGSMDKAREQVAEIKRRNPWRGHVESIELHQHAKDSAAIEREYQAMAAAFPDSLAPLTGIASIQLNTGKFDAAWRTLDQALQRHPESMVFRYMVGRAGAQSGQQLERAERELRAYLAYTPKPTEPGHAAAHWRLGMIAERRGDKAAARAAYQTALKTDPKFAPAEESLKKLK
jgi:tetratricopeptide (TPR) repeat protein